MALLFYPHSEDLQKGTLLEKIELLLEAAERYKTVVLEDKLVKVDDNSDGRRNVPRDMLASYNWGEISRILREIRELPETSKIEKGKKATLLSRLAEVYEVLRSSKMPKLEAVRLALINEANQLRGGSGSNVI